MYYAYLETDRARMAAHNASLVEVAKARLARVAVKKKQKRAAKKESQA